MNFPLLSELMALPPIGKFQPSGTLDTSFLIPTRDAGETLEGTVIAIHSFLEKRYPGSFEIILVPNPSESSLEDPSILTSESLAKRFREIRVCPHFNPKGKGAALRTGAFASRGKWIFFTDSDLPYDLGFFDEAQAKLRAGYDLVTGNRRLLNSYFHVPVSLLPLAYGRHRLGLGFNKAVRLLLPIVTRDTQAGIKAISRNLAEKAFSAQICPGFLFDLEIFLTAFGNSLPQAELPVTLHLKNEKSTVRLLREFILGTVWLCRITWRNLKGAYGRNRETKILSRYRGAGLSTRLFLQARWKLTPYRIMASKTPISGKILDMGCGHGLLSLALALGSHQRQIVGIDHDRGRISVASAAAKGIPHIKYEIAPMMDFPMDRFSGMTLIDVMHYFDRDEQDAILRKAFYALDPGGTLLVREVNPKDGWISRWNRFYEKAATRIGFTQAKKGTLHFRTPEEWAELLSLIGFQVTYEPCSSFLFSDVLFTCRRPLSHSIHLP